VPQGFTVTIDVMVGFLSLGPRHKISSIPELENRRKENVIIALLVGFSTLLKM
jgi:hypothetical protein